MSRRGASIVLSVLILMSLAACIRLLPDQWSPLPYNIDGLSELRVTQDILGSHHLQFPADSSHSQGYVADMPVLGVLTAFICSSLGLDPVPSSQLVIAILGAVTVSIVFLLSLQLWPDRRTATGRAAARHGRGCGRAKFRDVSAGRRSAAGGVRRPENRRDETGKRVARERDVH